MEKAAGAILASWYPAGASWLKYSVMSGGGAEEDLVLSPWVLGSLFFLGLPMMVQAMGVVLWQSRQAR